MKEKKFYGMKPSYKFMKAELKGENNEYTGFYYHGMNLVYYCIKHDLNESEVNEYLDKEIKKCKKYLNNHTPSICHEIPYHIYKDIINTSKDDFQLHVNRNHKYDYENHKYIDEIEEYNWYEWVNKSIPYTSENNRYKTFFRQCSEHSIALDELYKRRGYCNCEITLNKNYNKDGSPDKVFVIFRRYCDCGNEEDFKRTCLNYWHFIKLLDCVKEEDKNDIDIDELYAKKTKPDKIEDRTRFKSEINYAKKHTTEFGQPKYKTGVWDLINGVLTKLYDK